MAFEVLISSKLAHTARHLEYHETSSNVEERRQVGSMQVIRPGIRCLASVAFLVSTCLRPVNLLCIPRLQLGVFGEHVSASNKSRLTGCLLGQWDEKATIAIGEVHDVEHHGS